MPIAVREPADLGPAAVLAVADGARVRLDPVLLRGLGESREQHAGRAGRRRAGVRRDHRHGLPVRSLAVEPAGRPAYQGDLMLARAVGPRRGWTGGRSGRSSPTRLRTLLDPEAGISPALASALAALLDADLHPAVPASGNGAAGEIIPLAHLGGVPHRHRRRSSTRSGRRSRPRTCCAAPGRAVRVRGEGGGGLPAGRARRRGPRGAARRATRGCSPPRRCAVAAAEVALVRAPRDPYDPAPGARRRRCSARCSRRCVRLAGDEPEPRMLQAPVSFRVDRAGAGPPAAQRRPPRTPRPGGLAGVSTSPALVDGRFLGTAGFDGFDLAASTDAVRLAVLHLAETGAARLHRLLDPRVTGLAAAAVRRSRAGRPAWWRCTSAPSVCVHAARRTSAPASLGATETSLGQEDVQSFALESAEALHDALAVLRGRDGVRAAGRAPGGAARTGPPDGAPQRLQMVLHKASEQLPTSRSPTGRSGGRCGALEHVLVRRLGTRRPRPTPATRRLTRRATTPESHRPIGYVSQPRDDRPTGSESSMITFDEVTKAFPGGNVAVDNLSLELPTGQITVFVGPSGCGKTTSLRMINRTIEPTSGRISIDGEDVATQDAALLRRRIGYVIQHAGLFPHRTMVDNIATVPLLNGRQQEAGPRAGRRAADPGRPATSPWPAATRPSSPAGSSSASAWPGRWPPTRR